MIDKELLKDFLEQLAIEQHSLVEVCTLLADDRQNLTLYEQVGQISDRLFGAIAMLGSQQFAQYAHKIKELAYKCSRFVDGPEVAYKKSYDLIQKFCDDLLPIGQALADPLEMQKFDYDMKITVAKIERILRSYLHSIKEASVAFDDAQQFIFVYDKSGRLEQFYEQSGRQLLPPPKFFNALGGFIREFATLFDRVEGIIVDAGDNQYPALLKQIREIDTQIPIILVGKNKQQIQYINKRKLKVDAVIVNSNVHKLKKKIEKIVAARNQIQDSAEELAVDLTNFFNLQQRFRDASKQNFTQWQELFHQYLDSVALGIRKSRLDREFIVLLESFVDDCWEYLSEQQSQQGVLEELFLNRKRERVVAIGLIVGLVLYRLGAKKTLFKKFLLTALLQDISLRDHSSLWKGIDVKELEEDAQKLFLEHAKSSAQILQQLGFAYPLVEAVAMHHACNQQSEIAVSDFIFNPLSELLLFAEYLYRALKFEDLTIGEFKDWFLERGVQGFTPRFRQAMSMQLAM